MQAILIISIIQFSVVLTQSGMESFVVHGDTAKILDFPYVAYLAIEEDSFPWLCGSSIINQHITLTAAHCLVSCTKDSLIIVSVGHEKFVKGSISTAHSFVIHENYDTYSTNNDIGLVRLNSPIEFNSTVSRVALMQYPPYNEEAHVAGWGYINEKKRKLPENLIYTKQHVWAKRNCINRMRKIPIGTFCASSDIGGGYPAVGDSGSALVVRNYIQIGIVSYKKPDISRKVIIYTDTGYFYKWIKINAKRIMCN